MCLTQPAIPSKITFNTIAVSDKLGTLHPAVMKTLNQSSKKMIRYAAVSVDEVLSRVIPTGCSTGKYESWSFINNVSANVTPARLRTFKHNASCVKCGKKGNVFLVERHVNDKHGQYINLYSLHNHQLTLMTVDHILPDSLGGKYATANFQTMCRVCNQSKQNVMSLRDINEVIEDIDLYAKSWVDRRLLTTLLHLQKMYHISKKEHRTKFLNLYLKYQPAVKYASPTHQDLDRLEHAIQNLTRDHASLTRHVWWHDTLIMKLIRGVTQKVQTTLASFNCGVYNSAKL